MNYEKSFLVRMNSIEWIDFYTIEQEFYEYLAVNGTILKKEDGFEPEYHKIKYRGKRTVLAPPMYVRAVISVSHSALPTIRKYKALLEALYREAMDSINKPFKTFPTRFPTIEPDLEQINIWRQTAISSKLLKHGEIAPICRFYSDADSRANAEQTVDHLKTNYNIQASILKSNMSLRGGEQKEPCIYVTAPVNELLSHFGVENIRCRRASGTQYRAHCYAADSRESFRVSYGLVITTGQPTIYETLPQPERAHKTTRVKKPLTFSNGDHIAGQFVELYEETK
ncbi:hypothetical protein [Photobacterium leiognathi]|uniref:hypothetical protein n=1 Tax=Photobacterium leiognathi TaxID=553611 RepID=UPI002981074E|nr:hypothetical protein [Photobacterium leiognathi]